MSSGKKPVAKKPVAKAPASKSKKSSAPKSAFHASHAHLFSKQPRNFGIGRAVRPKTDLSRYVKWPRYVRLQRQRAILKKRLKVPPAINQFAKALDKNQASTLFRLLAHYRPESRLEKATRLKAKAESEVKGAEPKASVKPLFVKYGLNHITTLVESKKAKLVIIAHDVDPIELVVWLPALCRKLNVPYVIVKGKARLGHVVHKKSVSALALTEVRKEDLAKLEQFVSNVNLQFRDNTSDRKKWGGGLIGIKATHVVAHRNKIAAREAAKNAK
jgi:large subunit ribosomal protein L7Ae